jgi:hypothetical protein
MDIERFMCDEQNSLGRNAVEDVEDFDSGMKSIRKTVRNRGTICLSHETGSVYGKHSEKHIVVD